MRLPAPDRLKELNAELTKIPGKLTMADQAAGLLEEPARGCSPLRSAHSRSVQLHRRQRADGVPAPRTGADYRQHRVPPGQIFLQDVANRTGQKVDDLSKRSSSCKPQPRHPTSRQSPMGVQGDGQRRRAARPQLQPHRADPRSSRADRQQGHGLDGKNSVSRSATRSPGALSIASRASESPEQELTKLVETGNLMARDFFPAFEGPHRHLRLRRRRSTASASRGAFDQRHCRPRTSSSATVA